MKKKIRKVVVKNSLKKGMRKIVIKDSYGTNIYLNAELSEESKKMFPNCAKCWDDIDVFKNESKYCCPCNLFPLLSEEE